MMVSFITPFEQYEGARPGHLQHSCSAPNEALRGAAFLSAARGGATIPFPMGGCVTWGERKVWTVVFLFISFAAFLSGVIMLPLAIPNKIYVDGLTVEVDFPFMQNTLPAAGQAEITNIFSRPVLRRVGCGDKCEKTVCDDDFIVVFSWSGGDASGPITLQNSQLEGKLEGCHHGCNRYGGWAPILTGDDRPSNTSYDYKAVSIGWTSRRWDGDCDKNQDSQTDPDCTGSERNDEECATKLAINDRPATPADWFLYRGAVWPLRVPPDVDKVPFVYKCPSSNYNLICARVGELVVWELEKGKADALGFFIAPLICLPLGLLLFTSFCAVVRPRKDELGAWLRRCCSPCGDMGPVDPYSSRPQPLTTTAQGLPVAAASPMAMAGGLPVAQATAMPITSTALLPQAIAVPIADAGACGRPTATAVPLQQA